MKRRFAILVTVLPAGLARWRSCRYRRRCGWRESFSRRACPTMAAKIASPNLAGPVTVIRDANAVPHIFADEPARCLPRAWLPARAGRFFQMELMRRIGNGRLGGTGRRRRASDRPLHAHPGCRPIWPKRRSTCHGAGDARAAVDAYTEGVNAWLQSPQTGRPAGADSARRRTGTVACRRQRHVGPADGSAAVGQLDR